MKEIERFEVISAKNGRLMSFTLDDGHFAYEFQDDGNTLKVFLLDVKPAEGDEE